MHALYKALSRLPNYVKAFGLIGGLKLLPRIERSLPFKSERTRGFRV